MKKFRTGVFISYSHHDQKWLGELKTFLTPVVSGEEFYLWDDREIRPGSHWLNEIEGAIESARVAILLVSPDFLASKFIAEVEIPRILKKERSEGLIILWIPIRAANYEATELKHIQAVHSPAQPLATLPKPKRDVAFVEIAKRIASAMNVNRVANSLQIIDEFGWQAKAVAEEISDEQAKSNYGVIAHQNESTITFQRNSGPIVEKIEAHEFESLPEGSLQLIRSRERAMEDLFTRWTELYPRRYAEDDAVRQKTITKLKRIRQDMCGELVAILDFLERDLKKQLYDHYYHIRNVCARADI